MPVTVHERSKTVTCIKYFDILIPFPTTQIEETFDESAFFGASGCMKCLRKDELMLLIGGVVKDQVAGLHSQIDSQNQRILMVRNLYGSEERGKGVLIKAKSLNYIHRLIHRFKEYLW